MGDLMILVLGALIWQAICLVAYYISDCNEDVLMKMAVGMVFYPLFLLATPIRLYNRQKRVGGYTWSLLKDPDGCIVRVWPRRKYKRGDNLVDELRDVGYQFLSQDELQKLTEPFDVNPWSPTVMASYGYNSRYVPWAIVKPFQKVELTKELRQQIEDTSLFRPDEGDWFSAGV